MALAYTLCLLAGSRTTRTQVVRLACDAERAAGVLAGTQDQLASAFGGAGLVTRHRDIGTRAQIVTDMDSLASRTTLVHPGGDRHSGSIIESVLRDTPRASALAIVSEMNAVGRMTANALSSDHPAELARCVVESTLCFPGYTAASWTSQRADFCRRWEHRVEAVRRRRGQARCGSSSRSPGTACPSSPRHANAASESSRPSRQLRGCTTLDAARMNGPRSGCGARSLCGQSLAFLKRGDDSRAGIGLLGPTYTVEQGDLVPLRGGNLLRG